VSWQWIESGGASAVMTIRDPRGCVASDLKFLSRGFEKSRDRLVDCLNTFPPSRQSPHVQYIAYEQMADRTVEMVGKIAAHLGIEVTDQEIAEIDGRTNRDASRQICNTLRETASSRTEKSSGHSFDPTTLLHHNHIDSGKVGRWKEELSPEQVAALNQTFEKWMPILGYSL
jgi:hypothetical protein